MTVYKNLKSFIMIAQLNNVPLNPEQIIHSYGIEEDLNETDILRISKKVGLKTSYVKVKKKKINQIKLPAMVKLDQKYVILAKYENDSVMIFDPLLGKPDKLTHDQFFEVFTGEAILVINKKLRNRQIEFGFKWFIPTVIKYKKAFIDVLVAAFSIQLLGLISPLITQVVIDKVLVHKAFSTLTVMMIGLLLVTVFELILGVVKNYVFTHTTSKVDVILSARLFDHLFRLPLRYFESRRVGDTIARVKEVENIRRFITGTPLSSILDLMFIIIYIIVMFIYSRTLTYIVLLTIPLYATLSLIITPIFRSRLEDMFSKGAENHSFLVESVSGIQTIKSFALEPLSQKRWEDKVADHTTAAYKTSILSGNAGAVGQFIQKTSDLVILWLGAQLVMSGSITVGQLIAFRMLSSRVSGPILRIVRLWQDFQQTAVSVHRLGDIFNAIPEPYADASKLRLPKINGEIKFEHVSFRYRVDAPEVIRDMSLHLKAGKTYGIVGRSGSGKSTLNKLVQRLYIPESGKILIDGIDLSLADPHWLRRQIGVVLQDNFLFSGSVKDNICIHMPTANMEQIVNVAIIAGAHDFILELPEGYDTEVGERGASLSGGQRQRVAIARALISNPKILIFDEATSALDYESERIIQKNLEKICHGRTVLIIAHRLSTIVNSDEVIVLDKGSLIEKGPHSVLMKQGGLYSYLFTQQAKDESKVGVNDET